MVGQTVRSRDVPVNVSVPGQVPRASIANERVVVRPSASVAVTVAV